MMSDSKRANALFCIAESDKSSPNKCEGRERSSTVLSPITGIAQQLMNSVLSPHDNGITGSRGLNGHSPAVSQGMFKNAFKIKSTPENTEKSKGKSRVHGMAARCFSSPESMSPSDDKENSGGTSPQKIAFGRKPRNPLEECDLNSRHSGCGATSHREKIEKAKREGFRFAQPRALAPRRLSVDQRSPMESPVRSSPYRVRVARHSLFRSISSGYESMEEGLNDLADLENLDGGRLPNGISTLLNGDIVSGEAQAAAIADSNNPSTPEFARTHCDSGNVRRSTSSQKLQENRKNSDLSKVRSCLFRSPTTSSSTTSPIFDDSALATKIPTRIAGRRRATVSFSSSDANPIVSSPRDTALPLSCAFKRPDSPLTESMHVAKKLRRSSSFLDITVGVGGCEPVTTLPTPKCVLPRSYSESAAGAKMEIETESETESEVHSEVETHALIKSAIHRSTTNADLTGDFSKPCVLPLAEGHHDDLRSISTETMAALIRGEFKDQINSFKIVDCRYPYEFDGGHIQGAVNLYNRDMIEQILLNPLTNTPEIQPDTNKRNILVFHCEFSWERGPNLSRFLRSLDRQRNKEHYPALHYPEVYLLHGGYQQFYKEQKELCSPQGYRPMRDPDHEADLRQFRNKSKSWQGEKSRITGSITRTSLKRLGF